MRAPSTPGGRRCSRRFPVRGQNAAHHHARLEVAPRARPARALPRRERRTRRQARTAAGAAAAVARLRRTRGRSGSSIWCARSTADRWSRAPPPDVVFPRCRAPAHAPRGCPRGGRSAARAWRGRPGGWNGLVYYRLHGSPRKYWSRYERPRIAALAAALRSGAIGCRGVVRVRQHRERGGGGERLGAAHLDEGPAVCPRPGQPGRKKKPSARIT